MPLKKKKTTKKTGTKKTKSKEPKPEIVPTFEVPEWQDPKLYTPKTTLTIVLAQPVTSFNQFQVTVPITTRVEEIKQMIIQYHGNAINNVELYLDKRDGNNQMDPDATLES